MSDQFGAIIIGTGDHRRRDLLELARSGSSTLNVDKKPAAGYGSTSTTCAIIRFHYSTAEGVAMARESYYHWLDWPKYLGAPDENGMARYINTGCLVIKDETNHFLDNVMALFDGLNLAYEELDPKELSQSSALHADTRRYGPPVRPTTRGSASRPTTRSPAPSISLNRATSTIRNWPATTTSVDARPAAARISSTPRSWRSSPGRRDRGVKLADGPELLAPVVVNVAGPHSFKINRLAEVEAGMRITTRALKKEVCHVPSPTGVDFDLQGTIITDGDTGSYARPEVGNHVLIGSIDPECDPHEWVDPDDYDQSFSDQWRTQVMRAAQRIPTLPIPDSNGASSISTTCPTTGCRSTTPPISPVSTWRSEPRAPSSRTHRSWASSWRS